MPGSRAKRPCGSGRMHRSRGQRGKAKETLLLIDRAKLILEEIQPAGVRAICDRLFVNGWLRSMGKSDTDKVSTHLVWAREQVITPWEWIVDETRPVDRDPQWTDIPSFMKTVQRAYRRDYWMQQGIRLQVWSEKATVCGILAPVLHEYGVGWCYVHGYGSATRVHETAEESLRDTRQLVILYVGDWDCSGMHMSEVDLPERLLRYGGRVTLQRIALTAEDIADARLPSFSAKRSDPRYQWFVQRYGARCWELDAMNPNDLRERVEAVLRTHIHWGAWERCRLAEAAEQDAIRTVVGNMIISGLAAKKSPNGPTVQGS
jgi:hypothetical protein